jgi:hypothetical protein
MTASKGIRARRSDAGIVRPTGRDVRVLRWLGEMYGAPLPVVAELYGVGARAARRYAGRLIQAGFASRQLAPAEVWLVPTRAGLHYAGLEQYERWDLVGWKAAHMAAVCRMRLALERQFPGAGWESERAIRQRWHGTGARVRIPDGILGQPGRRIAVEVELHRKAAHRYVGILADLDPDVGEVWWFVGGGDVAWLRRVLADIPCAVAQVVHQLPEGVAR